MERQQAVVYALGCELFGLALLIFIDRLLPAPFSYAAALIGFILLMAGLFLVFRGRRNR